MSKIGNCLSKIFNPGEMAWQSFKQSSRARQVLTFAISILVAIPTLGFAFAPVFRSLAGRVKTIPPTVADKVNQVKTNMELAPSNSLGQNNSINNKNQDDQETKKPLVDEQPKPTPLEDTQNELLRDTPIELWHTLIPVGEKKDPINPQAPRTSIPTNNPTNPVLPTSSTPIKVVPLESPLKVEPHTAKKEYSQMNFACFTPDKVDLLKSVKDFLPGVEVQTYSSEEGVSYKQNWQILFEFIVTRFDEDRTQMAFQKLKTDNPNAKVIYVRMHYGNTTYTDSSAYWRENLTKPDAEVRCLVKKDFTNDRLYIANPEGLANALKTMVKILESKEKSEETHFTYGYPLKLVDRV